MKKTIGFLMCITLTVLLFGLLVACNDKKTVEPDNTAIDSQDLSGDNSSNENGNSQSQQNQEGNSGASTNNPTIEPTEPSNPTDPTGAELAEIMQAFYHTRRR